MANNSEKIIKLTVALMSDLHCHHSRIFALEDQHIPFSHLNTDKLRKPSKDHPIESLLEIINERGKKLRADLLLCPGDITNEMDKQGFISGWDFINEIGKALNVNDVVATVGNHDVDSRHNISRDDIFEVPMKIGKFFPVKDKNAKNMFWANGFCFVENTNVRILVLNSARFHISKDNADRGKIDTHQIEEIDKYLKSKNDQKIHIALCHHHPMQYEIPNPKPEDTIENGGTLIDILNSHNFDLLIHGHRHHPFLKYCNGTNDSLPIFSAGSFSAKSSLMMHGLVNSFHIIDFKKIGSNKATGKVTTWEYIENTGWRLASAGNPNLPRHTGFGCKNNLYDLINQTVQILKKTGSLQLEWDQVINKISEIQYLTPQEYDSFEQKLLETNQIQINYNRERIPKSIGKQYIPK